MMNSGNRKMGLLGIALACLSWTHVADAARVSDIARTKHNFSASTLFPTTLPDGQTREVRAQTETQICVFCHTPHAANPTQAPLWNRSLSTATYTMYGSAIQGSTTSSLESSIPSTPSGVSKLCLSCHDGTMAIGAVNVLNGSRNLTPLAMTGTGTGGTMPAGDGATTGYTRNLGINLTNDHPISMRYDDALATADGEMRPPSTTAHIRVRTQGPRALVDDIHLEPSGAVGGGLVQCNSCHDPHIRDTDATLGNIKFLRLNRLQRAAPAQTGFSKANDIICLACHDKAGWSTSAHAVPQVANEVYTNAAADTRQFPRNTQVWQTACLACHDTHAVEGTRRLLRDGTDAGTITSSAGFPIKQGGGRPAIEETCYACHSSDTPTLTGQVRAQAANTFEVPDIKQDFTLNRRMPITAANQPAGREVHDIGSTPTDAAGGRLGQDFIESYNNMGRSDLNNRHAECTDCHNPHRVVRRRVFNQHNGGGTMDPAGTHDHSAPHSNIASGVLRGTWGVEPVYSGTAFGTFPTSFIVKRGDPSRDGGGTTNLNEPYVTREYQVCMKCHSNYSYPTGYNGPPLLGSFTGGTPSGTNSMTRYTNQAMEYQSPASHQGEGTAAGTGAAAAFATNNHRGWHPVMNNTGRDPATRGNANANLWIAPFNGAVGTQTMYCSDCHGSGTPAGTVVPEGGENGRPWGPHGSNNDFILKGPWNQNTGVGAPNDLCFRCHQYDQYANPATATILNSGFAGGGMCMMGGMGGGGMGGGGMGGGGGGGMCMGMGGGMGDGMGGGMNNLHIFHANAVQNFRCNLCHIAVPHGWKNKNFLVNLNDVGPEGGLTAGTQVRNGTTAGYFNGPYYNRSVLKVVNFALSGNWQPANCGSTGAPGNGLQGVNWMAGGSEACVQVP